mmetsp:Transcript_66471/g.144893  ORF Transcript_66471/g.144893 Transcript_66471/m.144893 type:complete len:200 (-) Transcript_66471:317-916(-)
MHQQVEVTRLLGTRLQRGPETAQNPPHAGQVLFPSDLQGPLYIGATPDEEGSNFPMVGHACLHQGARPILRRRCCWHSVLEKEAHHRSMPICSRGYQRSSILGACGADLMPKKEANYWSMSIASSSAKCTEAALLHLGCIRPVCQQERRRLHITAKACQNQRRCAINRCEGRLCPALQEQVHDFMMPSCARLHEGGKSI